MNYAAVKKTDVANGPGVRVSLFVSGCTHHCPGCFNAETWDFSYGQAFTEETVSEILDALAPEYIRGLTVLGGEPFEEDNRPAVIQLLRSVRAEYPDKDIWCYTGYDFERDLLLWIMNGKEDVKSMLELLDILVDGEFLLEKKNLRLKFRGSENQRVLRVSESLRQKRAITAME